MNDFDENPLDILDGDGDDAVEMNILFDDNDKGKQSGNKSSRNSGCCVLLFCIGAVGTSVWYGLNFLI